MTGDATTPPRQYWCFISYRHTDNRDEGRQWASWLHQALETYEVPEDLVGTQNERGEEIPKQIFPVFRDEEELSTGNLTERIYSALDHTKVLVVLCSPRTLDSDYVYEEIRYFKQNVSAEAIHAAIVDGDPGANAQADGLCLPDPLRFDLDADGKPDTSRPCQPLAANFRLEAGRQGWTSAEAYRRALEECNEPTERIDDVVAAYRSSLENAKLQLIAGILGVPLGILKERDKLYQLALATKRAKTLRRWLLTVSSVAVLAILAAWFAIVQRQNAVAASLVIQHEKYASDVNAAEAADLRGNTEDVHETLAYQNPVSGREDLREFAWFHLWHRYHSELRSLQHHAPLTTVKYGNVQSVLSIVSQTPDAPEVFLTNWRTGTVQKTLNLPETNMSQLTSNHDLTRLTGTDDSGQIHVWELGANSAATILPHGDEPQILEFTSEGQYLVSAELDDPDRELKTLRLWNLKTRAEQTLPVPKELADSGGTPSILNVAVSPSGTLVAVALDYKASIGELDGVHMVSDEGTFTTIVLWDYAHESTRVVFKVDKAIIGDMEFSPSADILAVGFGTRTRGGGIVNLATGGTPEIRLFDTSGRREPRTLRKHRGGVFHLVFADNGESLISLGGSPMLGGGEKDGELIVWDLATDQVRHVIDQNESGYVSHATISPGSQYVAFSTSTDIQLWSLLTWKKLGSFRGHSEPVTSYDVNSAGIVATASRDGTVKFWRSTSSTQEFSLSRPDTSQPVVTALAFTPDPEEVIVALSDGTIYRADSSDMQKQIGKSMDHGASVKDVYVSPNGKYLASTSKDDIKIWNLESNAHVCRLDQSGSEVERIFVNASANRVFLTTRNSVSSRIGSVKPEGFELLTGDPIDMKLPEPAVFDPEPGYELFDFPKPKLEFLGMDSEGNTLVLSTVFRRNESPADASREQDAGVDKPRYKEVVAIYDRVSGRATKLSERESDDPQLKFFRADLSPDRHHVSLMKSPPPFTKHYPGDAGVVVFDLKTRTQVAALKGHFQSPFSMQFTSDGSMIRTMSYLSSDFFLAWTERTAFNLQSVLQVKHWDTTNWRQVASINVQVPGRYQWDSSPNGDLLALTSDGAVGVFDTRSNSLLSNVTTGEPVLQSAGFDRTGNPIAIHSKASPFLPIAKHTQSLRIRDINADEDRWEFSQFAQSHVSGIACSTRGNTIAVAREENMISLYTLDSRELKAVLKGHAARITCLAVDEEERLLVSGDASGELVVWNLKTAAAVRKIRLGSDGVSAVTIAPDGSLLIAATGNVLTFRNPTTGERLQDDMNLGDAATCLAIESEGKSVAFGSVESSNLGILRLKDRHMQTVMSDLRGIQSLAFDPTGRRLAIGATDGPIAIYDRERSGFVADLHPEMEPGLFGTVDVKTGPHGDRVGHGETVTSLSFSADGQYLASASTESAVFVWNTETWGHLNVLRGHFDAVTSVRFCGGGSNLVTGSADGSVKLWDASTVHDELIAVLKSWSRRVEAVALSSNGEIFATRGDADGITIWDTDSGKPVSSLKDRRRDIKYLRFVRQFVLAATESEVVIWDTAAQKKISTIRLEDARISVIAPSADGRLVAIATDEAIDIRRTSSGKKVWSFAAPDSGMSTIALSADGELLAAGFKNGIIKVWNVKSETYLFELRGHSVPIKSIAFSSDTRTIASGDGGKDDKGEDTGSIRLWDASTGRRLLTFPVFSTLVRQIDFSSDGTELLATMENGGVKSWLAATPSDVSAATSTEVASMK